jgi:type IV pilus assembly protein PilN
MIKVNLVPADILAKAQQKQQALQAAALGVLVLIIVALVSVGHYYRLNRLERTLAIDNVELKKLEVIVAKVEELEKTAAAVRARLNVITDLLKGRPLYPYFMSDFVKSVPSGIRVRSLTTSGGGSAAGALKLTMAAQARTNEDIAAWVRKMEESGRFSNVELGAVLSETGLYSFTVTSTYTPQL